MEEMDWLVRRDGWEGCLEDIGSRGRSWWKERRERRLEYKALRAGRRDERGGTGDERRAWLRRTKFALPDVLTSPSSVHYVIISDPHRALNSPHTPWAFVLSSTFALAISSTDWNSHALIQTNSQIMQTRAHVRFLPLDSPSRPMVIGACQCASSTVDTFRRCP